MKLLKMLNENRVQLRFSTGCVEVSFGKKVFHLYHDLDDLDELIALHVHPLLTVVIKNQNSCTLAIAREDLFLHPSGFYRRPKENEVPTHLTAQCLGHVDSELSDGRIIVESGGSRAIVEKEFINRFVNYEVL